MNKLNSLPQPKLRVLCHRLHDSDFCGLTQAVDRISFAAEKDAQKRGKSVPIAVLFAENALKYRFEVERTDTLRWADAIVQMLPKDIFIAVAYNVLDREGRMPANSGFLITADRYSCLPKRALAKGDLLEMQSNYMFTKIEEWEERGYALAEKKTPFGEAGIGNEIMLEYRVCADFFCFPKEEKHDTVTLVSAQGLAAESNLSLIYMRKAVIINDGDRKKQTWPKVLQCSSSIWKREFLDAEGGSAIVTLHE